VPNRGKGIWDTLTTNPHNLPLYTRNFHMLITLSGPWELGGEPGPDLWEIGEILGIPDTHPGWKLSPLEGLL